MSKLTAFKAYDVRGRIPDEINEPLAYAIGRAYAGFVKPRTVAVGYDIRETSPGLARALTRGLLESGVDVLDIGLGGTEGSYFATAEWQLDGGIMVTASHNPPDYNGMKFVREGARPISADTGLKDIEAAIVAGSLPPPAARPGVERKLDIRERYLKHLLGYVETERLRPLKVVVNAGNGGAGLIVDLLEPHLPFRFIKLHHEPDGTFPHGVPNPMLEENREATRRAVLDSGADVGLAWDGDYDRCFFFDEEGTFIEGYYLVGLLAQVFLRREAGARIVHDPRLTWNTIDVVTAAGGVPVLSKSGHAFIKQKMREVDGAYGGEMSAHHYFRSFAYCDSGMIPWLLVLQVISESGQTNTHLADEAREVIARAQKVYAGAAQSVDFTDGLSVEFPEWRFNLRGSNTEPLVRLNVESRGSTALMQEKTEELLRLIRG